jgi:hypothetical protein
MDGEQRSIGRPRRSEKTAFFPQAPDDGAVPACEGLYHHGHETAILQGPCSGRIGLSNPLRRFSRTPERLLRCQLVRW